MKKAIGCLCCLCLLPVLLPSLGILEAIASPGDFFRDKFLCIQAVTDKAKDAKCLECHGEIIKEKDLTTKDQKAVGLPAQISPVVNIHAQHMGSGRVNFSCLTCHQQIDPYQTSAAGIRNQVPANMCFKCHFPHGKD